MTIKSTQWSWSGVRCVTCTSILYSLPSRVRPLSSSVIYSSIEWIFWDLVSDESDKKPAVLGGNPLSCAVPCQGPLAGGAEAVESEKWMNSLVIAVCNTHLRVAWKFITQNLSTLPFPNEGGPCTTTLCLLADDLIASLHTL